MNRRRLLFILMASLLLNACSDWDDPAIARAKRAAAAKGDIVIGAVWPWQGPMGSLWQGIELAVDEINASGGVLNRPIRIVKVDDEGSLATGRLIAQQFSENLDMVAVIGHLYSYIALPASTTYQNSGMLYLTPGATSYQLNDQGYKLFFRSIPSNRTIGKQMANYMADQGYQRIAIYYVKDKNSQNMANYFEQQARERGLTIVDRRSFTQGTEDFGSAIQNWKDLYLFDALFLAANMPEAAQFVVQARKMGLTMPIVGGDGLDTHALMSMAGKAAEGIVIPETFMHDDSWPAYQHFNALFVKKYNVPAHTNAAQGYDAVHLLAQAMRRANSTVPEKVADALRTTAKWPGATGEFTYDDKGDIPDKKIGQKRVQGGEFKSVEQAGRRGGKEAASTVAAD